MNQFTKILKQEFFEIQSNMRFEFLKIYRRKKLHTIFIISVLITELFYLAATLGENGFPENSLTFISNVMGSIGLGFVLFASFLGADAINREHSNGTDLLIFPLPQRRSNIILAKYLSQLITAWIGILIYYGLILFHTTWIYGVDSVPKEIITSLLVSFVYMSTVMAFAFLVSASMKSTAFSSTFTFFGLLMLLPLLSLLIGLADIDVSWLFINYESLVTDVLRLSSIGGGPFQSSNTDLDFTNAIFHLIIQTIVLILSFLYLGNRKEVGS